MHYKVTDKYYPAGERTIIWNDTDLKIDWPLTPDAPLLLSEKDKQGVLLKDADRL